MLLKRFEQETILRQQQLEVVSGTASSLFVGATALGALWLVSGSSLIALLASSIPAWAQFDPIFLVNDHKKSDSEDDVSVADLIQSASDGSKS